MSALGHPMALVAALSALLLCSQTVRALPADYVFVQGFEPGASIEFVEERSALFTAQEQTQPLQVVVRDTRGNPVADPSIRWILDAGPEYRLDAVGGSNATVAAEQFQVGSAALFAVDTGSGLTAVATLAMAEMAPDTHLISSDLVISGATPASGETEVVLVRTAVTESLGVGDVLVSDDRAGLLVRLQSAPSVGTDDVTITVSQAKITDAFINLDISARSVPQKRRYRLDDTPKSGAKRLSDDLDCQVGTENAIGFTITGPSVDLDFDLGTEVDLTIVNGDVDRFTVAGVATAALRAQTGSLAYASNITGTVNCTFQLPEIFTPAIPISAFSFQLNTAPTIGFEFEAGFSGPSFTITGPTGRVTGRAVAGIDYTSAGGWQPKAETGWEGVFEPLSTRFNANVTFNLKGGPFVTNEFGLVANLGRPPLGLQLADLRFIRLKGSGELDFVLASPLNVDRKDYVGPRWDIDAILTAQYQVALADGLLFSLLNALDVPTQIDALTGDIFEPIEFRIAEAPLPQIGASCSSGCPANPIESETVALTLSAPAGTTGQGTFLATPEGNQLGTTLGSSNLANGQASLTWHPPSLKPGATTSTRGWPPTR